MSSGSQKIGGNIAFGGAKRFDDPGVPRIVFALIGLGTGAGLIWAIILICPVPDKVQRLILVGACVLFAALAFSGETGRKLVALSAGIIFPSIACLECFPGSLERYKGILASTPPGRIFPMSFIVSIVAVVVASLCTMLGVVQVIGLLASRPFMMHQEQFLGIKVQHAIPLFIVGIVAVAGGTRYKDENWDAWKRRVSGNLKAALDEPARFGLLILGIVALAALALVVARTGNDAGVGVSGTELKIRAILDHFLPVRPRTKEFLVGHPAFVLGIAWWIRGRRRIAVPTFVVGSLGQVSLLNTFCHIHTPLLASLWRGGLGLLFGTIFGAILFLVFERILPAPQKPEETE